MTSARARTGPRLRAPTAAATARTRVAGFLIASGSLRAHVVDDEAGRQRDGSTAR
jgi:hypothetical protein